MSQSSDRTVIPDVPRLAFGPQSDLFSTALSIVLPYYGGTELTYPEILCRSGRGFKICWDDEMFFWDRFGDKADPDPEYYLRNDYETMRAAATTAGFAADIVTSRDCLHPIGSQGVDRQAGADEVRDLVVSCVRSGRPVIAFMSISSEFWAPECSLITGLDDSGATVLGWSPFQDEEVEKGALKLSPEGYVANGDWETGVAALLFLREAADGAPEREVAERESLELGVRLSAGLVKGNQAWGLEAYEAWAGALEDESDVADLSDEDLKGRMLYYRHLVGHLAAQKWYTSSYLRGMKEKVWSVYDISHAAGNYARIHEVMWECWKVAGGYWRDSEAEVPEFRDSANRHKIAGFVREMKQLDEAAVNHLSAALEKWDKTHRYYMDT